MYIDIESIYLPLFLHSLRASTKSTKWFEDVEASLGPIPSTISTQWPGDESTPLIQRSACGRCYHGVYPRLQQYAGSDPAGGDLGNGACAAGEFMDSSIWMWPPYRMGGSVAATSATVVGSAMCVGDLIEEGIRPMDGWRVLLVQKGDTSRRDDTMKRNNDTDLAQTGARLRRTRADADTADARQGGQDGRFRAMRIATCRDLMELADVADDYRDPALPGDEPGLELAGALAVGPNRLCGEEMEPEDRFEELCSTPGLADSPAHVAAFCAAAVGVRRKRSGWSRPETEDEAHRRASPAVGLIRPATRGQKRRRWHPGTGGNKNNNMAGKGYGV
jgi:hypothetical protein